LSGSDFQGKKDKKDKGDICRFVENRDEEREGKTREEEKRKREKEEVMVLKQV
jgi:hypothetical protein